MTRQRPKRIGLTGNIGSGKSTVAKLLADKGAALIDADALARQATKTPEVLKRIAGALGAELVREGRLDREATARRVFGDPDARQVLNGIVHPWVRKRSAERVAALERQPDPPPVVLMDIPLLYENGLERGLDAVIVVAADLPTRIRRVQDRNGLSEDEVRARDAAQMPLEEKVARAGFVVDNNGDLAALQAQVDTLWNALVDSKAKLDRPS